MKKIKIICDIVVYLIFTLIILIPLQNIILIDSILAKNLDLFYGVLLGGFLPISVIQLSTSNEVFQKTMLFVILFFSGYSTHIMIGDMISSRTIKFYAGTLYMINPYTYVRIIAGHWFILFSYAVLPFVLKTFIDFLNKKDTKEMIKFTFLLSIVAFNIHMLIISIIIMTIIFIFWFNKYRDIRITKLFAMSGMLFILLNSYWIIPVLTAKNTIVDNITDKDLEVFATKGSLFEIVAMYGFWREGYIYTKDILPGWQILYLIILSLAIIGFLTYYKDEKIGYIVKAIGIIGIIGFILASGIKGPFGDQMYWLFDNTILKGFRDSHKFVAMIVFAYAILGGLGINKLEEMRRNILVDEKYGPKI